MSHVDPCCVVGTGLPISRQQRCCWCCLATTSSHYAADADKTAAQYMLLSYPNHWLAITLPQSLATALWWHHCNHRLRSPQTLAACYWSMTSPQTLAVYCYCVTWPQPLPTALISHLSHELQGSCASCLRIVVLFCSSSVNSDCAMNCLSMWTSCIRLAFVH